MCRAGKPTEQKILYCLGRFALVFLLLNILMCVNNLLGLQNMEEEGQEGAEKNFLVLLEVEFSSLFVLVFYLALYLCNMRFWIAFSFLQNM